MSASNTPRYAAVVIGVSAGGLAALDQILPKLRKDFAMPVLVVQHIKPDSESYLPQHYNLRCPLEVKEAEDKVPLKAGTIYFSPPNYHLMVECDRSIALSIAPRVNFSRPSVDVLFETAAEVYGPELIGIVLTGANSDGAKGLAKIKRLGGLTVVQSPKTANTDTMPKAAIAATRVDHILPLEEISTFLNSVNDQG
ncbi:chemotaxis protein CheB [Pseudodesulfovibrio sediminis]|uniref:protein-glutamate methylesterase n=1 Tax=Pseudodesulfovibrio sediminis TaxID=2810563 RepID=A0ABN6EVI1_9BACT|nr:chemotaxis protein CheB [Pseudodesulfovibrio sediminis]BCS89492.1 putative chemotaxis protein-glutamate methylesterase [Pseudodesulfovibrio sediminis]